jgi:hypothetical protein
MKKTLTLLTVLGVLLLATTSAKAAVAQTGPVELYNPSGIIYQVNTSTFAPDGTFVQVYLGANTSGTLISSTDSVSTFLVDSGVGAGQFYGGYGYTGQANDATGVQFTMVAWTGAATYQLALTTPGAYAGSVTWTQSVGNQPAGNPLPTPTLVALSNPNLIMVASVPEPTTIVLGAMGGLALLARRRKA